jgi:hypothetical protein
LAKQTTKQKQTRRKAQRNLLYAQNCAQATLLTLAETLERSNPEQPEEDLCDASIACAPRLPC